jgi:hypothetical protein
VESLVDSRYRPVPVISLAADSVDQQKARVRRQVRTEELFFYLPEDLTPLIFHWASGRANVRV